MNERVQKDFHQLPAGILRLDDILLLDFLLEDAVTRDDLYRERMHGQLQVSVIRLVIFTLRFPNSTIMALPGTQTSGGRTPRVVMML